MIFKKKTDDKNSLFGLTQAYITLNVKLGAKFTGGAALCVKESTGIFNSIVDEVRGFLDVSDDIAYRVERDRYGYIWFILNSDMLEGVVAALDAIADTFIEYGFKEQILASVFAFNAERKFYLIYNHRSNKFYPFVPSLNGRDVEFELFML